MVKKEQKFYNLFLEPLPSSLFKKLLEETLNVATSKLDSKGEEYVRNGDRLHNFNEASKKRFKQRERALDGMRLKHEISIDDILNDIDKGLLPDRDVVIEKFGDRLVYDILEMISILHRIELDGKELAEIEPAFT